MPTSAKVRDYMSASLVTLAPDTGILEAIQKLLSNRISGAPVVDDHGNLVGMLSEKDCMRVALESGYHQFMGGEVREYMTAPVKTIDADTSVIDVARLFIDENYRRFPVMQNNRLVGQISRRDALVAIEKMAN